MKDKFVIKNLVESKEIQRSYDKQNYLDAVMKCRAYLEAWMAEYIYVILFPNEKQSKKEDRDFVHEKFPSMHIKINWLKQQKSVSDKDYANLNNIRIFTDNVLRSGEVFKSVNMDQLDHQIELAVHYCAKFKEATRIRINRAAMVGDNNR